MSKPGKGTPAANGKQQFSWILFAIWAISAVWLFRTFGQQQAPQVQPKTSDLLHTLEVQNQKLLEVSASKTMSTLGSALDAEEKAAEVEAKNGKLSAAQLAATKESLLSQRIEGAVLVGDAYLRAGEKTDDYMKYLAGDEFLQSYADKYSDTPAWKQTYTLPPVAGVTRTWSGDSLYQTTIQQASERSKKNLVFGFFPGYAFVNFLVGMTGHVPSFSFWFAMLALAVAVRGLVWPLYRKQVLFGRQMMQLQPLVKEIREKHKDEPNTLNAKTMELYKEYGINPYSGCLPALIQWPFFYLVYESALCYRFEFLKGTFLWINPHVATLTHGLTAPNLGAMDKVLIVIYGVSMVMATMLAPVSDPSQAKQQRTMGIIVSMVFPLLMLFGAYPLPAAFVLYWTFSNFIAMSQSLYCYRLPVPALEKKTGLNGAPLQNRSKSWLDKLQDQYLAKVQEVADSNPSGHKKTPDDPIISTKLPGKKHKKI